MVQSLLKVMGQNNSLPKSRRKSLRSFSRKSNSNFNSLSHTFTINDCDQRIEHLNINTATEEELMTLAGVNREIAKSIVEHRRAIGRFRKIEDLALVRGIGADKLEDIRPEICVSNRKTYSCASSRAQSYDSVRSVDSRLTIKSNKVINLNKANVFDLQTIHGVSQEIAAAIIHYRDKKGPFKKVEDLSKVKCIDAVRFNSICRYLTVDLTSNVLENDAPRPTILTNGYTMPHYTYKSNGHPVKIPVSNGLPPSSAMDIFELLTAFSPRPIMEEVFQYARNGEAAIRVGSWNLHDFSLEKVNNLGVREIVARTILENGWSILAVQDVCDVLALRVICEEMNKPKLRRISEWKDKNHNWNFCMLDVPQSRLGFVYDSDGAVDIELMMLNEGPSELVQDCEFQMGLFRIGDVHINVVNILLFEAANVFNIHEKINNLVNAEQPLLVLVDFSNITTSSGDIPNFESLNNILIPNINNLFNKQDITTPCNFTNILSNNKLHNQLTGLNGVVRQGLTHLAIPNGWSWGGPVSPFCPVWIELFLNPNPGTAL